jgi:hypothetical protein
MPHIKRTERPIVRPTPVRNGLFIAAFLLSPDPHRRLRLQARIATASLHGWFLVESDLLQRVCIAVNSEPPVGYSFARRRCNVGISLGAETTRAVVGIGA